MYQSGEYAPFKMLNFDTLYVDVMATQNIIFEVVAQDNETKILYQLELASSPSDAYVTSNVYLVNQNDLTISMIPDGTNVTSLSKWLIPAPEQHLKYKTKPPSKGVRNYL
jgi:hypothetical protein